MSAQLNHANKHLLVLGAVLVNVLQPQARTHKYWRNQTMRVSTYLRFVPSLSMCYSHNHAHTNVGAIEPCKQTPTCAWCRPCQCIPATSTHTQISAQLNHANKHLLVLGAVLVNVLQPTAREQRLSFLGVGYTFVLHRAHRQHLRRAQWACMCLSVCVCASKIQWRACTAQSTQTAPAESTVGVHVFKRVCMRL